MWTKEYVNELFLSRNTKDKKQLRNSLLYFFTVTILGIGVGLITNSILLSEENSKFWLIAILFTWLDGILLIVIHEAGHFVGGIITSYRFQSFRVFSYCIVKEDNKYKIEKRKIPGTSGQCLMKPPKNWTLDSPFFLYHAGGGIATFLVSMLSLLLFKLTSSPLAQIIFFILFGYGLILTIINLVPLQLPSSNNDGANILAIRRDKTAKETFFKQLECNAWLSDGRKLEDISEDYLKLSENAVWSEPLNYYLEWILYSKFLKEREFDKAEELLMKMEEAYHDMLPSKKIRIDSERLYLLIIRQVDTDCINTFYKNVADKLRIQKLCTPILRTLIAYEKYSNNNNNNNNKCALEQYQRMFYRAMKSAACKQEAEVDYILTYQVEEACDTEKGSSDLI